MKGLVGNVRKNMGKMELGSRKFITVPSEWLYRRGWVIEHTTYSVD